MNTVTVGKPNQSDPPFVDMPDSDAAVDALAVKGYVPAVPPRDYDGSINQWMREMTKEAGINRHRSYGELCDLMVRADIWEAVLDKCELST